ncbi:hypothetical protein ACJMK2_011320 [Sinanodonta woodiana]|uniref:Uncharacterized protein n=1 Tax=Sinanodonta woodiana TaxID=1069815 RepID=A0ABD3V7R7_SINWO
MLDIKFMYGGDTSDDDSDNEYYKEHDPDYYSGIGNGKSWIDVYSAWYFLSDLPGLNRNFEELLYHHDRNLFDFIVDDRLACNQKMKVKDLRSAKVLHTGVEKYYLVIDWNAVEESIKLRKEEIRRLCEEITEQRRGGSR